MAAEFDLVCLPSKQLLISCLTIAFIKQPVTKLCKKTAEIYANDLSWQILAFF